MPPAFLPASATDRLRDAIAAATRAPEPECVSARVAESAWPAGLLPHVEQLARELAQTLRDKQLKQGGVAALMAEFSLSSREGVALMCLAEALLRIPDVATRDALIRDKLAHGQWREHLGHSRSIFVNAAAWGLLVTGKLAAIVEERVLSSALTRLLARGGEPLVRKGLDLAMRLLGETFVTGRTIDEALARVQPLEKQGFRYSFDMLGEAAMMAQDAERYLADYEHAIHAIGRRDAGRGVVGGNGISVKLSALHPRYHWSQPERVHTELLPRLLQLCRLAKRYDIGLNIDAEEADRLELSLDLLEAALADPELAGWDGLGFVVQAYQKRAPLVIDWLVAQARARGRRLMVRLVKGAYWDSEIKRAQVDGLTGYPVYTRKVYTDVSYLACARRLLAARDVVYPQFATHNAHTLAAIFHLAGARWRPGDYEFQCLHGMGEPLYASLVGHPERYRQVRIYAPVGSHETLLPYLVRRLLENGANTSFVNRIAADVPLTALLADPVARAQALGGAPHPRIPAPPELFAPQRRNSLGLDLADRSTQQRLAARIAAEAAITRTATPLVGGTARAGAVGLSCRNPADVSDLLGAAIEADAAAIEAALETSAHARWGETSPQERAQRLEAAADALEAHSDALFALIVREAGKTWADAVGEIREAVDFCRYYAAEMRCLAPGNPRPLGPVVCISPWNFPLSIFVGQIAAALAAGNAVLAKPAEQTPLTAFEAVRLLHEAGIPGEALQLLPGRGETVGARLVASPRIRGVMFTGSTAVARAIQRTLAARAEEVPLIAETGGLNAMVVDSSALTEQVVADALTSAFNSAGQRCSALRVLCLQEEIADKTLGMLLGALRELRLGDPRELRTDVGPVIDVEAKAALEAHVARMARAGYRVHRLEPPPGCAAGTFVAPTVIEIDSIESIGGEHFGPILHVQRFRANALDALLEEINATGYGLTMGVHSRIAATVEYVAQHAQVGNLYVNRNLIGAVVGVQPFGGEGLSGTGPKAGGPLYLLRLLAQAQSPHFAQARRPAEAPDVAALRDWLEAQGEVLFGAEERQRLLALLKFHLAHVLAPLELPLPGPTGEDNRLRLLPRRLIGGIATTPAGYAAQLVATVASCAPLVWPAQAQAQKIWRTLPAALQACCRLSEDLLAEPIDLLLFEGEAAPAMAWRQRLAERPGPIVPLLTPPYRPERLARERSISVNTAAVGGNASLMTLED
ncbi:bifunctional proline dehydrogenase/L-glutamate gamma-semialdehyde dehydrogenase PutA [Extensimonas vulgaris]|uniref:Bifunctional protein PutA n=1 Tax=Extensimonas vulgaris TaxID=1031594 RepID=A0A369ARF3_9BURK|nr:bifunctional proline dehydrogenase/L-glutamate gamma-semialdehyde dehydrogenase PutA [Extensimonas vulgaris]RCX11695.1 L-proline dehydrogenase /delta-1-pyrroline-5-carboxylate dehydrogenase [Extensimonas vulgaris]TWI40590.1 L-proline dehydrogenase /delta-1-pyrroline-5-carboxylate dehydrogenase [Extensimonas vulgaris]TXD12897.1 bifunctional proline dehydrogenase/L-glutamate gamma-semialdehyde dehydrogenase PutA [Extensimonas vulgaris]